MKFEFLQNPYKAHVSMSHHPDETCKIPRYRWHKQHGLFYKVGYMNRLITSSICNSGKVRHNSQLKHCMVEAVKGSCRQCRKHKCRSIGGTHATAVHVSIAYVENRLTIVGKKTMATKYVHAHYAQLLIYPPVLKQSLHTLTTDWIPSTKTQPTKV